MKKRIVLLLIAALALIAACAAGPAAPRVTFLKAGKADAAVLQTENGVVLVDTGLEKNSAELIETLRGLGVERIDALILSHFDRDHVGGAAAVLEAFPVGIVYQSNVPKDSGEYEAYRDALEAQGVEAVTVTDRAGFVLDGLALSIDGPGTEEYPEDPSNNSSLIVTAAWGDTTVLFAGDAQDARLEDYLTDFSRPDGTVVLKVPYHGHWQESLPDFLDAVFPDIAVIPCGKDEPEAEELARTIARLESLGAEVRLTRDGDTAVEFK